jgi:hypothetical protein
MKPGEVQLSLKFRMRKNGFQFRAEAELSVAQMKIQRLDSKTIARQNSPPCILRPNGHREHAAEAREAIFVPSQKGAQNNFRVAAGIEFFSARFQFRTQFAVVVNLTVKDEHGVTVLANHGLSARIKVNDL